MGGSLGDALGPWIFVAIAVVAAITLVALLPATRLICRPENHPVLRAFSVALLFVAGALVLLSLNRPVQKIFLPFHLHRGAGLALFAIGLAWLPASFKVATGASWPRALIAGAVVWAVPLLLWGLGNLL